MDEHLVKAGTRLLSIARESERRQDPIKGKTDLSDAEISKALTLTRADLAKADPKSDPHRYLAVKQALETLEAKERGDLVVGHPDVFDAHVEAIHGGARKLDLGGVHVTNKRSANEYYLEAAAIELWKRYPADHDQIASETGRHGIIASEGSSPSEAKRAIEKRIAYLEGEYEAVDAPGSPLFDQYETVLDLIEHHGHRRLIDFL